MVNDLDTREKISNLLFTFSEPGYIEFEETINLVKESVGKAEIKVVRINGADGKVSVHYRTKDIDAVGSRDYERKFTNVHYWFVCNENGLDYFSD